jgi:hypothetical protein
MARAFSVLVLPTEKNSAVLCSAQAASAIHGGDHRRDADQAREGLLPGPATGAVPAGEPWRHRDAGSGVP